VSNLTTCAKEKGRPFKLFRSSFEMKKVKKEVRMDDSPPPLAFLCLLKNCSNFIAAYICDCDKC